MTTAHTYYDLLEMGYESKFALWLSQKSPEDQAACLTHLDRCQKLGELQRIAPHSQECVTMAKEIAAYHLTDKGDG